MWCSHRGCHAGNQDFKPQQYHKEMEITDTGKLEDVHTGFCPRCREIRIFVTRSPFPDRKHKSVSIPWKKDHDDTGRFEKKPPKSVLKED